MRNRLLGSIFSKSIRDWTIWTVVGAGVLWGISTLYIGIMSASGDVYVDMIADMPEALGNIYGMNDGSGEGLAMSGIFMLMGPLVLLTYAIGLGSSAAVGEEEARTLNILLTNPLKRRTILFSKTAVVVIGVLVLGVATWLGVEVMAGLFGMDLSNQNTIAATIQMLGMTLFFGALALGISAWRGSSGLGIAVAAGIAVASYFITTLLPVVEELAELAKVTPWYLLSGADALNQGLDPVLVAIGVAFAAVFFAVGLFTLERRDLKG